MRRTSPQLSDRQLAGICWHSGVSIQTLRRWRSTPGGVSPRVRSLIEGSLPSILSPAELQEMLALSQGAKS